jgi:hypothetical protein
MTISMISLPLSTLILWHVNNKKHWTILEEINGEKCDCDQVEDVIYFVFIIQGLGKMENKISLLEHNQLYSVYQITKKNIVSIEAE